MYAIVTFIVSAIVCIATLLLAYRIVINCHDRASQADTLERFNSARYPERFNCIIGENGRAILLHEAMTESGVVSHIITEINSGDTALNRILAEELSEKLDEIRRYSSPPQKKK